MVWFSTCVNLEDEFALFRQVCDILFQQEKYEELQRLVFSALGSPVFARSQEIHKECEFLCLLGMYRILGVLQSTF